MLALTEKAMLIQALGQVVYDEVQTAIGPMKTQLALLEKTLGDMPVPTNGQDGKDGKDADMAIIHDVIIHGMADIEQHVRNMIEDLPKAEKGERGEKGETGEAGAKGDPGERGER